MIKYIKFFVGFVGAYIIIKGLSYKYKKMYPRIRNENT